MYSIIIANKGLIGFSKRVMFCFHSPDRKHGDTQRFLLAYVCNA